MSLKPLTKIKKQIYKCNKFFKVQKLTKYFSFQLQHGCLVSHLSFFTYPIFFSLEFFNSTSSFRHFFVSSLLFVTSPRHFFVLQSAISSVSVFVFITRFPNNIVNSLCCSRVFTQSRSRVFTQSRPPQT